jgi:hypothetical protein
LGEKDTILECDVPNSFQIWLRFVTDGLESLFFSSCLDFVGALKN